MGLTLVLCGQMLPEVEQREVAVPGPVKMQLAFQFRRRRHFLNPHLVAVAVARRVATLMEMVLEMTMIRLRLLAVVLLGLLRYRFLLDSSTRTMRRSKLTATKLAY